MNKRVTDVVALKKIMVEKRLDKICDLSRVAGVSRVTLGNILSGKTQPSAEVMNKLIVALNIAPEQAGQIFFKDNLLTA